MARSASRLTGRSAPLPSRRTESSVFSAHDERVAQGAGGVQVLHVAAVQDVEDAVGEDDGAAPRPAEAVQHLVPRHHLLRGWTGGFMARRAPAPAPARMPARMPPAPRASSASAARRPTASASSTGPDSSTRRMRPPSSSATRPCRTTPVARPPAPGRRWAPGSRPPARAAGRARRRCRRRRAGRAAGAGARSTSVRSPARATTASAPCPTAGSHAGASRYAAMRSVHPRRSTPGRGEDDGVVVAAVQLGQAGVQVAAQVQHGQVRPQAPAAARGGGASWCPRARRAEANRGPRIRPAAGGARRAGPRAPSRRRGPARPGRRVGTSLSEWTARSARAGQQRRVQLLGEEPLVADLGQRARPGSRPPSS